VVGERFVAFWHEADIITVAINARFRSKSRRGAEMLRRLLFDPERTSVIKSTVAKGSRVL
jgi:hypothetical protein